MFLFRIKFKPYKFFKRLEKNEEGNWRLVNVDSDVPHSNAPRAVTALVKTTAFQTAMMVLVLLNAIINASFVYRHDKSDEERKQIYYYIEVG